MKALSDKWTEQKNSLDGAGPWVWLYEVNVPSDPAYVLRIAEYPEKITWAGNDYAPWPIQHSVEKESGSGEINAITLTVSNITREIQGYLEEYHYLSGQKVSIYIINLQDDTFSQKSDFYISSVSYDDSSVSFTLSLDFDILGVSIGRPLYRDKCAWRYKGPECGYSGAMESCDKTLGGPTGCRPHGNVLRFGGAPGIPQGQVIIQ